MSRRTAILLLAWFGVGAVPAVADDVTRAAVAIDSLEAAPELERETLARLLEGSAWTRRAIAAMRLERYACEPSLDILLTLRRDESWQVRTFAILALGRRGAELPEDAFSGEHDPKVLRTAIRSGYYVESDRLERGIRFLARSHSLGDLMLAVELGAASDDPDMQELARKTLRTIILRMGRIEAGALSPRLSAITGQPDMRRRYRWQRWLRKAGRRFPLHQVAHVTGQGPGPLASLSTEQFADLEGYIADLGARDVDLAILLDCTASMSAELADAQGGIDDLMLFAGDVVGSLRVSVVAYRDKRDEFETRGWDFTSEIDLARRRLWSLTAGGGGDTPEAVFPALQVAYRDLTWHPEHTGVLVLIGDAPPHIGFGAHCVTMAATALRLGITTHSIQAESREVKHFPQIAEAGGGRCVTLPEGGPDTLIVEITGLTLGGRFEKPLREFFRTYLALCR